MVILPDRLFFPARFRPPLSEILTMLGAMAVRRVFLPLPLATHGKCEIEFRKTKLKFADAGLMQKGMFAFSAMRNLVSRFLTASQACH